MNGVSSTLDSARAGTPAEAQLSTFGLGGGDLLPLLLIVLTLSATSVFLGGDGSPDFRIYHFYNGYAAASGGRQGDIAAAQMQTYFFPGMDILYYWLTMALNEMPRTLRAILAIPYIVAACCVYLLAKAALPATWPARKTMALLAAGFGISGAASLPTLGTSMSDIVPGTFVLLGLCAYLHFQNSSKQDLAAGVAGLCCGIAVGLKLTCAPLFIGFAIAMTIARLLTGEQWLRGLVLFGLIGGLAVLGVCGGWWLHNYSTYGNPLFPAFNDIFKSDFAEHGRWSDDRFKPRNWLMALFYPFYWAFVPSGLAIELATRDARLALSYVCVPAIAIAGVWMHRRKSLSRSESFFYIFLPVFIAISFVLWERLLSIYRYLAVLEVLAGLTLLLALMPATRLLRRHGVNALLAVIMAWIAYTTVYPWWSRSTSTREAVHVEQLPSVAPASTVVFLDAYAMSYLAPFFSEGTRFIGANNNMIHPGGGGGLQKNVEAAIRSSTGEIWGLEFPPAFPGMADATLLYYGLERVQPCTPIQSNIEEGAILMCRLRAKGSQ